MQGDGLTSQEGEWLATTTDTRKHKHAIYDFHPKKKGRRDVVLDFLLVGKHPYLG